MKLGHEAFIEEYLKSIIANKPPPVSPEEGIETIKLMEMIVRELNSKNAT
jgi:hypothetical protein